MMRGVLTLFSMVSVIIFPWPLTALLALGASFTEPLAPFAVGVFADTLYYTPSASTLPFFALAGAVATTISFLVRSRLRTGIIKR